MKNENYYINYISNKNTNFNNLIFLYCINYNFISLFLKVFKNIKFFKFVNTKNASCS